MPHELMFILLLLVMSDLLILRRLMSLPINTMDALSVANSCQGLKLI